MVGYGHKVMTLTKIHNMSTAQIINYENNRLLSIEIVEIGKNYE